MSWQRQKATQFHCLNVKSLCFGALILCWRYVLRLGLTLNQRERRVRRDVLKGADAFETRHIAPLLSMS
jgi:hypothetical protein